MFNHVLKRSAKCRRVRFIGKKTKNPWGNISRKKKGEEKITWRWKLKIWRRVIANNENIRRDVWFRRVMGDAKKIPNYCKSDVPSCCSDEITRRNWSRTPVGLTSRNNLMTRPSCRTLRFPASCCHRPNLVKRSTIKQEIGLPRFNFVSPFNRAIVWSRVQAGHFLQKYIAPSIVSQGRVSLCSIDQRCPSI